MRSRWLHPPWVSIFFAMAFLAGCSREPGPSKVEARAALTVELVSPAESQWSEQIEAVGRIAPWQESIVGAEIGDLRIEKVLVNVGDEVVEGQLLARFSADAPSADLKLAEAGVAQAEASAELAQDKAARARRLGVSGTLSQEDALQFEVAEKTSAAQLASAQAQLRAQQLRMRQLEVRAPESGIISARSATVGAVATMGGELFRLIVRGRLEWRASVPADQLSRISPGQGVALRQVTQGGISGVVRQVSPVVDAATLNGVVFVDLSEPGSLRTGMFVAGEFLLPATRALHVPESALVFRDGFQYLMAVDGSNHVKQTKVSIGRRSDQSVELLGTSLTAADRVVRSGGSFLNEGDTVRVAAAAAAASARSSMTDEKGDRP